MAKELPTENKACDFHDHFSSVKFLRALLLVHIKLVIKMHVDEQFGKLSCGFMEINGYRVLVQYTLEEIIPLLLALR